MSRSITFLPSIVKVGLTGVNIFLNFALKHRLWVLVRNVRKPIGDISQSGLGRDWTLRRYILRLNDI